MSDRALTMFLSGVLVRITPVSPSTFSSLVLQRKLNLKSKLESNQ